MSGLKERVDQFACMELPGQPQMMHMGTSYLVNDLWREVQKLHAALKEIVNQPILVADGDFGMERALIRCQQIARKAIANEQGN